MAADGTWKIDLKTPMGAQAVTLVLATDGAALSGSLQSSMGGADFTDGTVDGDSISGTAKLGSFGDATFEGSRQ